MAHAPEARAALRIAYVHRRIPLEMAAEKAGISYATARRWKAAAEAEGDDWERARSVARISSDGMQTVVQMIAADYVPIHQAVMEEIRHSTDIDPLQKVEALAKLADAMSKTASTIGKFSPQMSRLAIANDTIKLFSEYVLSEHPHFADMLLDALDGFIPVLAKEMA